MTATNTGGRRTLPPVVDARRRVMVGALVVCERFGMTRDERLDLATTFLNRASTLSFNDLSTEELVRVRDGMEMAALVAKVCLDRRRGQG